MGVRYNVTHYLGRPEKLSDELLSFSQNQHSKTTEEKMNFSV